jgi:hypothetical protein
MPGIKPVGKFPVVVNEMGVPSDSVRLVVTTQGLPTVIVTAELETPKLASQ